MERRLDEEKSLEAALAEAFRQADALEGPLHERLRFYLDESRKLLPDLESTYDGLVERIRPNAATNRVPAIGAMLPGFFLTNTEGHLVDLYSLLAKGPLVISFNRGPWCDYCGLKLRALARAHPAMPPRVRHHFDRAGNRAIRQDIETSSESSFTVLTDLDLAYALSLGLVFWGGEEIKDAYLKFGIDLAQFQGHGGWLLPIPATLVVGSDGRVKARFVDPDFRHRMGMETILGALAQAK